MSEQNDVPEFFEERDIFGQPKAHLPTPALEEITEEAEGEFAYADFGERTFAYLIDIAILFVAMGVVRGILFDDYSISNTNLMEKLVEVFIWTLYYGLTESSAWQATIGKRICKIKVIDVNGNPLSFTKASLRFLAISLSFIALGLGIISVLINKKKQAWHDMLIGSYVIKTPTPIELNVVK